MKNRKDFFQVIAFLAGAILLINAASAAIPIISTQATSQVTVINPLIIELTVPENLQIPFKPPAPYVGVQNSNVAINSNGKWSLSVKGSDNGYMISTDSGNPLQKPLEIQFVGFPPQDAIELTGDWKEYLIGSEGEVNLPTQFIQRFDPLDDLGAYKITLYWQWAPAF